MPTDVTFVEVKNAFQAISGLESLTAADEFFLQSSTNRAVSRAYNASDSWPRYLVIGEERKLTLSISGLEAGSSTDSSSVVNGNYILIGQDNGDSGAVSGSNVYYNPAVGTKTSGSVSNSTVIYKKSSTNRWEIEGASNIGINADGTVSVQAGQGLAVTLLVEADSAKKDNPSEVITWTLTTGKVSGTPRIVEGQIIPYAQTGKNTVGEFLRVYRNKPFLNNSSIEYEFYVDSLGANVLNLVSSTDNSVFVNYKKQLTTGFTPDSTNIPSEFVDYIIYTALSDFYTGDGQTEKAATAAAQANLMLDLELLRLDKKANNNTINKKFSTYVNRQAR